MLVHQRHSAFHYKGALKFSQMKALLQIGHIFKFNAAIKSIMPAKAAVNSCRLPFYITNVQKIFKITPIVKEKGGCRL